MSNFTKIRAPLDHHAQLSDDQIALILNQNPKWPWKESRGTVFSVRQRAEAKIRGEILEIAGAYEDSDFLEYIIDPDLPDDRLLTDE